MSEPKLPPEIRAIHGYVSSIPFGEVSFKVKRVNRQTVQIDTISEETLKYVSNDEALVDLENFIHSLIESGYSGEAHVRLELKNGRIDLLGIYSKKTTKY